MLEEYPIHDIISNAIPRTTDIAGIKVYVYDGDKDTWIPLIVFGFGFVVFILSIIGILYIK